MEPGPDRSVPGRGGRGYVTTGWGPQAAGQGQLPERQGDRCALGLGQNGRPGLSYTFTDAPCPGPQFPDTQASPVGG